MPSFPHGALDTFA